MKNLKDILNNYIVNESIKMKVDGPSAEVGGTQLISITRNREVSLYTVYDYTKDRLEVIETEDIVDYMSDEGYKPNIIDMVAKMKSGEVYQYGDHIWTCIVE